MKSSVSPIALPGSYTEKKKFANNSNRIRVGLVLVRGEFIVGEQIASLSSTKSRIVFKSNQILREVASCENSNPDSGLTPTSCAHAQTRLHCAKVMSK